MKVSESLPWVFLLIISLVVVWLILVIATEDKSEEEYSNTTIANTREDAGFATIKTDETTGCEYFIFRNILTPRLDETGTKVRGCKDSE